MEKTLLAIDVGGTKCELAILPVAGSGYQPYVKKRYASGDYDRIEDIISEFLTETGQKPEVACLGVAGVVSKGCGTITNLPWIISDEALAAEFGFSAVRLINDLTAVCASISMLSADELLEVQSGITRADQPVGVIAPGTGLGQGLVIQGENFFFPRGSEGGHTDFAPVSEEQMELFQWLMRTRSRVSFESVIAGPGIPNIYDFYHQHCSWPESEHVRQQLAEASDRTPVIFNNAFGKHPCPLCRRVIDLFLSILGSEAGNLALKLYARGGIYIGGGIVPRIVNKISFDGFLESFRDKGKMSDLMHTIPVHVILNRHSALLGAVRYGRIMLA